MHPTQEGLWDILPQRFALGVNACVEPSLLNQTPLDVLMTIDKIRFHKTITVQQKGISTQKF